MSIPPQQHTLRSSSGVSICTFVPATQVIGVPGSIPSQQHTQHSLFEFRKAHLRQHMSAYVSIRQHTSAYVSIRQHTSADVFSIRQLTSAYVGKRRHTSAYVSKCSIPPPPHPQHRIPKKKKSRPAGQASRPAGQASRPAGQASLS